MIDVDGSIEENDDAMIEFVHDKESARILDEKSLDVASFFKSIYKFCINFVQF
jgi:hypothetical protein